MEPLPSTAQRDGVCVPQRQASAGEPGLARGSSPGAPPAASGVAGCARAVTHSEMPCDLCFSAAPPPSRLSVSVKRVPVGAQEWARAPP